VTPMERLVAAIVKLEDLQTVAPPAPWGIKPTIAARTIYGDVRTENEYQIAQCSESLTADLIVTLHRTVDAQLRILRDAAVRVNNGHLPDLAIVESAVALADAILEEQS